MTEEAPPTSFVDRLQRDLRQVHQDVTALVKASRITDSRHLQGSAAFLIGSEYLWEDLGNEGKRLQIRALKSFRRWNERFDLLVSSLASHDADEHRSAAQEFGDLWIERGSIPCGLPSTIPLALNTLDSDVQRLASCIDLFHGTGRVVIVPDTNALVLAPEVQTYGTLVGATSYDVVFVPGVIAELDKLKVHAPRQEFRDKVKAVIRRIKGWRRQGSLLSGITVHKTVKVTALAWEPSFDKTLPQLDVENGDDRILASVLELQLKRPGDIVVVLTGDLNMQTKAEAAGIPYMELPTASG